MAVTLGSPPSGSETSDGKAAPSVQELRLELARAGRFYLEMDLVQAKIRFCHSGVTLAAHETERVGVAFRRIAWIPLERTEILGARIWRGGRPEPPREVLRQKILPGRPETRPTPGVPGVIPPTLDELIPVPSRYRFRFEGGHRLEIRLLGPVPGAEGGNRAWLDPLRDRLSIITGADRGVSRIRAEMPADAGASLYRSLPEDPIDLLLIGEQRDH